jgi:hypothetical protein
MDLFMNATKKGVLCNDTTFKLYSMTVQQLVEDDTPRGLALTVIDDDEIDLTWQSTNAVSIERSDDLGVTYSEIDTVGVGINSYQDTGLDPNVHYYYRLRSFVGAVYSDYSNIADDWTAMKLVMSKTGTGVGVGTLSLSVTGISIIMTIDGSGKFYDDVGGTTNEGVSRTINAGTGIFYLKVTSGNSNILIFHKGNLTGFYGWEASTNAPSLSIALANFARTLTRIASLGNNTISGALSTMPTGITHFYVTGQNITSGVLSDVPAGMTYYRNQGSNTVADYTSGHTWNNNINFIQNYPAAGSGLSITELSNLIYDVSLATWAGSSRSFAFAGNNASMADTNQGGIWGDFSGVPAPSALATAYKTLIKTKSVTMYLLGIAVPGVSGDGTGFPAGFGDWYRS